MRRAIYIGAGLDLMPVLLFPQIKEFLYVDSLPFSSHGTCAYDVHTDKVSHLTRENRVINSCSHPTFLTRLQLIAEQNKFKVIENTPDYLTFCGKDGCILQYFYSCAFPEHIIPAIANKLSAADTLIIAGHDPHHDVLGFMSPPFTLIINNHTIYESDPTDAEYETSTCRELRDNPALIAKCYKYSGECIPYNCQIESATKKYIIEQVTPTDIFNNN